MADAPRPLPDLPPSFPSNAAVKAAWLQYQKAYTERMSIPRITRKLNNAKDRLDRENQRSAREATRIENLKITDPKLRSPLDLFLKAQGVGVEALAKEISKYTFEKQRLEKEKTETARIEAEIDAKYKFIVAWAQANTGANFPAEMVEFIARYEDRAE